MGRSGDSAPATTHAIDIAPAGASAVEVLATHIRTMIVTERLALGDPLPSERVLCERFSASRNTVREAMRLLKAYGVVEIRPRSGATVLDNRRGQATDLLSANPADLSLASFADIQGFRSLIEMASAEPLFERAGPDDIVHLRRINSHLRDIVTLPEAAEADFGFHLRLIAILGNRAVLDVYSIMKPLILKIIITGKSRRSFATQTFVEHEAIVDALEARNRIHYQFAVQTHLDRALSHYSVSRPGAD